MRFFIYVNDDMSDSNGNINRDNNRGRNRAASAGWPISQLISNIPG